MKLVVLSGKGGTGKTSLTSSLALSLSKKKKLILVDADADCPNQSIIFPGKKIIDKELSVMKTAVIDYSKCNGCMKCVENCVFHAIEVKNGKPVIKDMGCEGCGACAVVCPNNAIKLVPTVGGRLIARQTAHFPLVYGELLLGKSGTGKIVYEARKLGEKVGKKEGAELTLIDAAAGIGCPVIASVMGCNYALGVVEPTPASIENMKRALEVVSYFKIPYSVIMNKAGISKDYEKKIEQEFGTKLIARIPYDKEIPHLLAQGTPPILGRGKAAKAFKEAAETVEKNLKLGD